MSHTYRGLVFVLVLAIAVLACAPPTPSASAPAVAPAAAPAAPASGPKRVVGAAPFDVDFLPYNNLPGLTDIRHMVNPGLVVAEDHGGLVAILAEAVPSLDNGLWKISDDGRMETTWRLRPNARWHDGTPFTAADLV